MTLRVVEMEEDDLFVLAPSVIYVERLELAGALVEGKSLGTAKELDLLFLDLDQTIKSHTNPKGFSSERKKGTTVGRRVLKQTQSEVESALLTAMLRHDRGKYGSVAEFRKSVLRVMKPAWKKVFEAGVRASGVRGRGSGAVGPLVKLEPADESWLRSAIQHEMRFLNVFMRAVDEGTWKMPLDRRVKMYARTLEAFYDSARVIGLPATVLVHWTGENDERTCSGCKYLFEHSPYTKRTLPTTPRAGLTQCLSNCRDKLLIRQSDSNRVVSLTEESLARSTHIKNLRNLKLR